MVLDIKKIVFTAGLLAMSITFAAQQAPATQQQNPTQEKMIQRLYEAQGGAGQWQRFGLLCGSSDVHEISGAAQRLGNVLPHMDESCDV